MVREGSQHIPLMLQIRSCSPEKEGVWCQDMPSAWPSVNQKGDLPGCCCWHLEQSEGDTSHMDRWPFLPCTHPPSFLTYFPPFCATSPSPPAPKGSASMGPAPAAWPRFSLPPLLLHTSCLFGWIR